MLPFMTQPVVAPACYMPRAGSVIGQSKICDGASLQRNQVAGDRRKMALVARLCPMNHGSARVLVHSDVNGTGNGDVISITSTGAFQVILDGGTYNCSSVPAHRDTAFMTAAVLVDTTQPVAADRVKVFVGRSRLAMTGTFPPQNYNCVRFNVGGYPITLLKNSFLGNPYNGLLSEMMWFDGVVPDMDIFDDYNIHGVLVPCTRNEVYAAVAAPGGFGPNGFHLDFSDPLTPGKDVSGQGNHFAASGFDATGKNTVASTPTNVYATLNQLDLNQGNSTTIALSDGNSTMTITGVNGSSAGFTMRASVRTASCDIQIDGKLTVLGNTNTTAMWVDGTFYKASGASSVGTVAAYGAGDEISAVYHPAAQTVSYYKNGVLQFTAPIPDGGGDWVVAGANSTWKCNFGQRPRTYNLAGGLCTDNLREPDVKDPADAFAQATAAGANIVAALNAGAAHWITDNWVEIIKRREVAEDWRVRFSDDAGNAWATNTAAAKAAAAALTAGGSYFGLRLRVGVKYGVYTAEVDHVTGTATTVTHGLSTARNAVIATRVSVGGGDRYFRHPDMPAGYLGKLNSNAALGADGSLTAFGANSFQIASTSPSGTYRVIVLAERPGYLVLADWTGNGAAEGVFAAMDTSPVFMLSRQSGGGTTGSGDWEILSEATSPANPRAARLFLNQNWIEDATVTIADMVVGGVKMRSTNADWNSSGVTYYGIAIGRPVGGVCVAPATAR